ncbi:uncharacterized protein LOC132890010 [Neoarius graeffei]|uniref:uncharacterized protein LOC132889998 n=1 Tax=Neoarius graeffei TaxID=443677 RepID=UPI00298BEC88|nr:uncharacterized protein LOC132889998 [Neoarius graeffei]XP_060782794.1 uncharacterized protein LOC132890010 [Neoarius graeffei]
MAGLWILVLIFSTMCTMQTDRLWIAAQSLTDAEVYQPDEELSVDICGSVTLRCCIFQNKGGKLFLVKQQNKKTPVFIAGPFNPAEETFHSEFQNSHFQINKSGNCFSLIISKATLSDEAMYYCGLTFSSGTQLKVKGTLKPALCDNSVASETMLHGNSTNMNTQEKSEVTRSLHSSVFGLGTALGFCALLIFCLIYIILRRRKCENCRLKASQGTMEEHEAETVNYAALKFSKQEAKAEKRNAGSCDECVYSGVKKTKHNRT